MRPGLKSTDTPKHSTNLWLYWQAIERFAVVPSLELASSRLRQSEIQPDDVTQIAYTRNSGFGLVNLDIEWQANNHTSVVFDVRNLLDNNYELSEGLPQAGRTFFLTTGV